MRNLILGSKTLTKDQKRLDKAEAMLDAYETYCKAYERSQRGWLGSKALRQVEYAVKEAGVGGRRTGLISEKAWQSLLNDKRGETVAKPDAIATEHPVTYRAIVIYLMSLDNLLSYEEYYKVWDDNLITVQTTNYENHNLLKPLQDGFDLRTDMWQNVYEKAGVKLIERPPLATHADKKKWNVPLKSIKKVKS